MTTLTMKLELVPIPTTDVDRAKAFYVEQLGFHADHDMQINATMRIVQLTPPGSACSILLGTDVAGLKEMTPGAIRALHLVVPDIAAQRAALIERGITIEEIVDMGGVKYAGFSDPDGNTWTLQEITATAAPPTP